LRMPYWDWAMVPPTGQDVMPSSLQRPTIQVVMPNGTNIISNPLYSYRFHPLVYNDLHDNVSSRRYWFNRLSHQSSEQTLIGPRANLNSLFGPVQSAIQVPSRLTLQVETIWSRTRWTRSGQIYSPDSITYSRWRRTTSI
jgi:hypothetical protein